MPETVITNDELAALINKGGKGADWAFTKLGIKERRLMTRLAPDTGYPLAEADELDMAEKAARKALANACLRPKDIDGIWYVSCTQRGHERHHFSTSAFELHRKLGLRETAVPLEMDAGCGGAVHAIVSASKMLAGDGMESMLIVASNAPSRYYVDWASYVSNDVWLSMYIFGDGAGATVLRRSENILSARRYLRAILASILVSRSCTTSPAAIAPSLCTLSTEDRLLRRSAYTPNELSKAFRRRQTST